MKRQNVNNKRTISLEGSTLERLKKIGNMGETYDIVVNRLIDEHYEHKQKANKK